VKYDIDLCKRLEAAEALGLRSAVEHAMAKFPDHGIALEEIAGATVAYCGPGSHFNQASGAGLNCVVSDDDLERIVAFYQLRSEPARIEVSPIADPGLPQKLSRRGFAIDDYENALTSDLTEISGRRDPRVEELHDAEAWAEISGRSFSDGADPE